MVRWSRPHPLCVTLTGLADLNRALDEFFDKYATKETAPDWLRQHPIHTCVDGADEDAWMGK